MSTFAKDTLRGYYNGDLASLRVIGALKNNEEIPDYLNAKASVENNKIVIDYCVPKIITNIAAIKTTIGIP